MSGFDSNPFVNPVEVNPFQVKTRNVFLNPCNLIRAVYL